MNGTVGILNYGIGNLLSIRYAIEYLEYKCITLNNLDNVDNINYIIFPGVGAFDEAIKFIDENNLRDKIIQLINNKKIKIIGICLGMQIACNSSEESNFNKNGLGIINGEVKKILSEYKPPLNGWSRLKLCKHITADEKYNFFLNKRVYLTHSYYCNIRKNDSLAFINHNNFEYIAVARKDNFIGLQFHPEKSGKEGLEILKKILLLKL